MGGKGVTKFLDIITILEWNAEKIHANPPGRLIVVSNYSNPATVLASGYWKIST
jgi:hypothetical protein